MILEEILRKAEKKGIKTATYREYLQQLYMDCICTDLNEVFILKKATGILPSNEIIQNGGEYYVRNGDLNSLKKLEDTFNVKLEFSDAILQEGCAYFVSAGNLEGVRQLLKRDTTKLQIPEDIVQKGYSILLERGDINGLRELQKMSRINPSRYIAERVDARFLGEDQKKYVNLLSKGDLKSFQNLWEFSKTQPSEIAVHVGCANYMTENLNHIKRQAESSLTSDFSIRIDVSEMIGVVKGIKSLTGYTACDDFLKDTYASLILYALKFIGRGNTYEKKALAIAHKVNELQNITETYLPENFVQESVESILNKEYQLHKGDVYDAFYVLDAGVHGKIPLSKELQKKWDDIQNEHHDWINDCHILDCGR